MADGNLQQRVGGLQARVKMENGLLYHNVSVSIAEMHLLIFVKKILEERGCGGKMTSDFCTA